ncbi:hypothetical protein [Providencia stuartii]
MRKVISVSAIALVSALTASSAFAAKRTLISVKIRKLGFHSLMKIPL